MQGLEEIAIIHSIDDYQAALSLKEFLKLNGFSYFTYAYNEIYDELNDLLKESNNHFDLIVYINDVSGKFQEKFGHLTNYNINVNIAHTRTESPFIFSKITEVLVIDIVTNDSSLC